MCEYSEDFIQRVKAAYPEWILLHNKLDKGDESVGDCLQLGKLLKVDPDEIISANESGDWKIIVAAAEQHKTRRSLYEEFFASYNGH